MNMLWFLSFYLIFVCLLSSLCLHSGAKCCRDTFKQKTIIYAQLDVRRYIIGAGGDM